MTTNDDSRFQVRLHHTHSSQSSHSITQRHHTNAYYREENEEQADHDPGICTGFHHMFVSKLSVLIPEPAAAANRNFQLRQKK